MTNSSTRRPRPDVRNEDFDDDYDAGDLSPKFSGMSSEVTSSTLEVSAALSVAVIGGVFSALSGEGDDAGQLAHAFIVALLLIATSQIIGAGLGLTIARQPASDSARSAHLNNRR